MSNEQPPHKPMRLNLTSMIDVIFLLLIFFVVTASFAVGEGVLTARLPKPPEVKPGLQPTPQLPITVTLRSYDAHRCRISIDRAAVAVGSFTELRDALARLQHDPARNRHGVYPPDNKIIIQPDGRVRWQHVVNAFNATRAAAYTDIEFAPVQTGL